jgi:hypothetical protein
LAPSFEQIADAAGKKAAYAPLSLAVALQVSKAKGKKGKGAKDERLILSSIP